MDVLIVLAIAVVAGAGGVWLGMLAAPRIGRLAERADEAGAEEQETDDGD